MPISSKKIQPHWVPKREKHQRIVDNSAFYNGGKWRRFARFYKDKHPVCDQCETEGRVGPADVADHIIRIEEGGEKYDERNIQSLCNTCHNRKSGRESKNSK